MEVVIPTSRGKARELELQLFARALIEINRQTGFKVSSRGWCYQLENLNILEKGDFDRVQSLINDMRKKGYLPIDFTALDDARKWANVEYPTKESAVEYLADFLKAAKNAYKYYTPDWWEGETYYIQMLVEKIDLKTLFEPVCRQYHIPISTAKGWSDINQRAQMAERFKAGEDKDGRTAVRLKPILLYCGDFDPFGVKIGKTLEKNMWDISGGTGWMPFHLKVDRFGLNLDFIEENNLSWIENLKTSAKPPKINDLADPRHPQHFLPEVQEWLRTIGPRKVEANALVVAPEAGRELCRQAIERWVGDGALERFAAKRRAVKAEIDELDNQVGVLGAIQEALDLISEID